MLITPLILTLLAQTASPTPAIAATSAPIPAAAAAEALDGPAAPPNLSPAPDRGWISLFNGQNFDGLYTFRNAEGKNNDTQQIFKVDHGTVHVMDLPDMTKSQPNGYLATNDEFRNYRVRVDYKWGVGKLPVPRHPDGLPRDAGLLYHISGKDNVWPTCVEFQIDEQNTGDVWLLPNNPPNPSADSTVVANDDGTPYEKQRNMYIYMEGGVPVTDHGQRLYHSAQYDLMDGWNTVEAFVTENNGVQVVNGHVNNSISNIQLPNNGGPLSQGRLALQQENNEVFYRNFVVKPLFVDKFGGPDYKILVFTNPNQQLPNNGADRPDVAAIKKLGQQTNFTVDVSNNPSSLTDDNLKQYKAVVFLNPGNNAPSNINADERKAFERYIQAGGGFVGVDAAAVPVTDNNWDWYDQLIGAQVDNTADGIAAPGIKLMDANHTSTSSLPLTWDHKEFLPFFNMLPAAKVHLLVAVDDPAKPSTAEPDPMAWCHDFNGGRSFFTTLGSTDDDYKDPLVLIHLLGGIMYAANTDGAAPPGATVLFDGTDTSHWVGRDNKTFTWIFKNGLIQPPPAANSRVMVGDIHTKETYTDFQAHVEFKVPGTKSPNTRDANTNEQARGNSGVYMQGRYEAQILDSYDHPLEGKNDAGAIYEVKDAIVNASVPAEVWQAYDITFHAARWQDGKKISNARATIYLNGVLVQKDTEIPNSTKSSMLTEGPEPGPLALQDHLNAVQFRYVWIKPLTETK